MSLPVSLGYAEHSVLLHSSFVGWIVDICPSYVVNSNVLKRLE